MRGFGAMVRRQLRVNRTVLIVVAALTTVNSVVQVTSFSSVFPDPATRAADLAAFTNNTGLRALYGYPYDIGDATGWLAWRSMGFMAMVMSVWAAFITVGALRGEEETGRAELALSQLQPRRVWFAAALTAVTLETLAIGAANMAGLALFCVPRGFMNLVNCLEVSLQFMLPALLFAAVGAIASQLVGTARGARIAAGAVLVVAFFGRTAADVGSGIGWVRWLTPLGWFEELHPPAPPSVAALLAIALSTAALVLVTVPMLAARDIGLGLLPQADSRPTRRFLLGSPWQAALRDDIPQIVIWLAGAVLTMLLMGSLTKTVLDLYASNSAFSRLLGSSFGLDAYISAVFAIVQVVVALLAVTLVAGARWEEATGRLELLLAAPLPRVRWLLSRAAVATTAALLLALVSAAGLWAGAAATGQGVGFGSLMGAALNCVPLILLTVGGTCALFALAPRATAFAYAPLTVAFLWDALGTVLKAPAWSLDLSPFHALAVVPLEAFALAPAAILTGLGVGLALVAALVFRGRDLAIG